MSARRSRRAGALKCASRSPRLLRCEQLESRTVLAAIYPLGNLHLLVLPPTLSGGIMASVGPSLAKAASAQPERLGQDRGPLGPGQRRQRRVEPDLQLDRHQHAGGRLGKIQHQRQQRGTERYGHLQRGRHLWPPGYDRRHAGLSITSSLKVSVAQTLTGMALYSGASNVLVNATACRSPAPANRWPPWPWTSLATPWRPSQPSPGPGEAPSGATTALSIDGSTAILLQQGRLVRPRRFGQSR